MEKLLEKTSSYNLLNNLIPGSVFCFLLPSFCAIDILSNSAVENLFIYYFVGMVLNRVGSIVIEPIAKKVKLVSFADHDDYIIASKIDPKIDVLLETSNLYRTIATGGILIIFVKIFIAVEPYLHVLSCASPYIMAVLLFVIFLLSFRKQTQYINRRVNNVVRNKKEIRKRKMRNESDCEVL